MIREKKNLSHSFEEVKSLIIHQHQNMDRYNVLLQLHQFLLLFHLIVHFLQDGKTGKVNT